MSVAMRRAAWGLAVVVALVLLVVFGFKRSPSAANGRVAPELPREQLSGSQVTLASELAGAGGRPVLVVFWASWCDPCIHEAPAIARFAESAAGRGRIVGVNWSDPQLSSARSFVRHYNWRFPNLRDSEGTVGTAYRLTVLPTTFVITRPGRISAVLRGPQSESSLEAALKRAERS